MSLSLNCSLANHGLVVTTKGKLAPCCQFIPNSGFKNQPSYKEYKLWKETDMQILSDNLDKGIQVKECGRCWTDEQYEYNSLRQDSAQWIALDKSSFHTKYVEFRLGNYCNLKCIMCNPFASSSIETEYIQHKELFDRHGLGWTLENDNENYWETDEFDQVLDQILDHIEIIMFTGGEPLIVPNIIKILDHVKNKNNVQLRFVTNMTKINKHLVEKFKLFRHVSFAVSLEGIGSHNNYVRYPSQFDEIESNIKILQDSVPRSNFNINHTVQHTSAYALPALATWCKNNKFSLHLTKHYGHEKFSFQSVPPADLENFHNWVKNTQDIEESNQKFVLNILDTINFDKTLHTQYKEYVNVLDSIRKINFDQTFNPADISIEIS